MAMKCTRPSVVAAGTSAVKSKRVAGRAHRGPARPCAAARRPGRPAARRRRARPTPAAAAAMASQPLARRPSSGSSTASHPRRRDLGVVDEEPATGRDDVGGVEPLLAVADRQRDVDRRQPDRGQLADGVGAGPARPRGRRRRRPGPCGRRTGRRRTGAPDRRAARRRTPCPRRLTCSTCTPAARSASTRCGEGGVEPLRAERAAGDQQRGPGVGQAEARPAPRRAAAARSSWAISRRSGMPTTGGVRQRRARRTSSRRTASTARPAGWPARAGRSARARRSGCPRRRAAR